MRRLLLALVGSLLIVGCGSSEDATPSGRVSGTVSYQQEPVSAGTIQFTLNGGGSADAAPLQSGGRYKLARPLPVGTYTVTISAPSASSPEEALQMSTDNIPAKYQSVLTSPFTVEVEPGDNSFDMQMQP